VRTLAHRELGARGQLEVQGFRTFLPMQWKTVRHARRFRTIRAPFFPRYLFARMNLMRERWRQVNGTIGVAGLVMAGDVPMPVPIGVVETLYAMCDADGVLASLSEILPGQRVRVLNGPFADRIGALVRADDESKVQILMDVMGVQVTVRASRQALAPVA
jgi:transcriptional antiterminator RfaH